MGALGFCALDLVLTGSAALHSNSLVILGDFIKECGDTLAVVAAFATIRAVRQAPSQRFSYGFGKLENLASMTIVALMLVGGVAIASQAFYQLRHPVEAEGTVPGIAIFSVYAVIAMVLAAKSRSLAARHHSPIVASQASLWLSKAWSDGFMALALIAAIAARGHWWAGYLDPAASLVGVGFMLRGAWTIASESVPDLLDAALEEATQIRILRCLATHFDDYELLHGIRTRRAGSRMYVELFLEFSPSLPMGVVLKRIEGIRGSIGRSIPGADITVTPSEATPATPD